MTGRGRESGMSVVEMLVALTLAAVVMVGGLALLVELQRAAAGAVAAGPSAGRPADVAVQQAVHDARAASHVLARAGGREASSTTLILRLPDGRRIIHALEGDLLERTELVPGEEPATRRLCAGVQYLDYATDGRLVEVTIQVKGEPLRTGVALLRNPG